MPGFWTFRAGWLGGTIWFIGWFMPQTSTISAASAGQIQFPAIAADKLRDAKNDADHPFPVGAWIDFDQNANPAQVDHDMFWNNHKNDVWLEQGAPPFHRIFNNTRASTHNSCWSAFHSCSASSTGHGPNHLYRSSIKPNAPGSHDLTPEADPRLAPVDEGGLKDRLRALSPATDHGEVIAGVTAGYVGRAPNLGACEYSGTGWVAGCALPALSPSRAAD